MLTLEVATELRRKVLESKGVLINIDGIEFIAIISNVEIKYDSSLAFAGIYRGEQLLKPVVDKITIEFSRKN